MFKKPFSFRKKKGNDRDKIPDFGEGHDALGSYRGAEAASKDPLGLKVVHRPAGQRRADVVFVHGLGGSSRMTWSHDHNPDFFWPLEFLPLEPEISKARILSFGYDANFRPGSSKNKMTILDFAKDLLFNLKYAQDESEPELEDLRMGEQPIIFIVHSMGGLVVKEAYLLGQNDPTYESIVKAVSSIIFLSTPHRGTHLADTLNRILQVSFVASPKQFIAELATGSQTLHKLNEQFRHVAPKLQIVSFYETRPTIILKKGQIMVLEKDSSVLGYPGEISKPLDADHHGVCKFANPDDPNYISIRNVLKTLIANSKIKEQPAKADGPSIFSFEQYLSVPESPETDYNFFRDRWTPGTCTWIEQNDCFKVWVEETSSSPRILWVNGTAASGKSILSSFIINHLVQLGLPCQYFLIRFISEEKRGLSMLLRSLACQLALSSPAYGDRLRQLEAATSDMKTANHRTIWKLLFERTLFHLDHSSPLYWVIDGVDEAYQPAELIQLLSELDQATIPLRVLILSRTTHEITSALQKLASRVHMDTVQTEGDRSDFRAYLDREIGLKGDKSSREAVVGKLLDRAKGNFLWLHLAAQKMNACYTGSDVERALKELPSGMEALYDRMAVSIQSQPNIGHRNLGLSILFWTTCARRLLSVDELVDALGDVGVLEIHRTIGDLCGGFVAVDNDGQVALIHETAREYLLREDGDNGSLSIGRKTTNDILFRRCIERLAETGLRSKIHRNEPPALLSYAMSSWSHHLVLGSTTDLRILKIVTSFLEAPHVLTWIHVAARVKDLRTLVTASRHLAQVAFKLREMGDEDSSPHLHTATIIEGWATDFVKIVGKFGYNLMQQPDSIYKLIPPFCPEDSMVYRQFGRKETRSLQVSGFTSTSWDDCLARFSQNRGIVAPSVIAAGSRIAILTVIRTSSQVIIYNAATFEEQRRIAHPERVLRIQSNSLGDLLLTYGYQTARLWKVATGECVKVIKNPPGSPSPHSLFFDEERRLVLACGEDRRIRSFSLEDDGAEQWDLQAHIKEQNLDYNIVGLPCTASISPDGNRVAFGYRSHPVTAWELEPPMLIGRCFIPINAGNRTSENKTWGEVFRLAWHPRSGEVIGLDLVGLLFLWDPYEEFASATVQTGANVFAVNVDGSLVATGDAVGVIKIYALADFSLLYQLATQSSVLCLCFSTDSRRLYDTRGSYGNVWEPNALVRLADFSDHNSNKDFQSEATSLAKVSLRTETHFARIDEVIAIAGQSVGPLYSYGTGQGVAILCDVGGGKVGELARLASRMAIQHIAWSEDGRLVALADLSRRVAVSTIHRAGENPGSWQVTNNFRIAVPPEQGHITQLIFHPAGKKLFACTETFLYSIDLESQFLMESKLEPSMPKMKWTIHPAVADALLGFGATEMYVFSWTDLRQREVYRYFPPRLGTSYKISGPSLGHAGSSQNDETLGRLISSTESPYILLQLSVSSDFGDLENQYLLFDVEHVLSSSEERADQDTPALPYTTLPQEVTDRISEPLAFLSRRRLAFLDIDRWICSWSLPVSAPLRPHAKIGSEPGITRVEKYYFLPGDWATGDETQIFTVTPDGTLLCPRNGGVVTVQAARLRKYGT